MKKGQNRSKRGQVYAHRPGSDVDIALKGEDLEEAVLQISIYLNQESILPYNFDIIDYHAIDNQELLDHINRVGKSIL